MGLAALLLLAACSNAPRRDAAAAPGGGSYAIGAIGAGLSARADDPTELARWQSRMQAEMLAGRPPQNRLTRPTGTAARAAVATAQEVAGPLSASGASTAIPPEEAGVPASRSTTRATTWVKAGAEAEPAGVRTPVLLNQAAINAGEGGSRTAASVRIWPWVAAGAAALLAALSFVAVRSRRSLSPATHLSMPAPANDREPPRRSGRRFEPPPPRVTILAGAQAR